VRSVANDNVFSDGQPVPDLGYIFFQRLGFPVVGKVSIACVADRECNHWVSSWTTVFRI